MSRHTVKYDLDNAYAYGYMIKTINNIGTTVVEEPANFVEAN